MEFSWPFGMMTAAAARPSPWPQAQAQPRTGLMPAAALAAASREFYPKYSSAKTRAGPIDSVAFVRDNLLRRFNMLPQDFIQQKQVGEQCAEMNGRIQIVDQL